MARIKIDLPATFSFSTTIPVRITDLNFAGHVGNDTILSIVHEARAKFFQYLGYDELNFGGVGTIMNDVAIEYKTQIYYGDEIVASVAIGEITKVGFDIFYKLEKMTAGGIKTNAARAKTGMICYNYDLQKIAPIPANVVEKITDL
jgi:acyl-CoA thioester hydrolase